MEVARPSSRRPRRSRRARKSGRAGTLTEVFKFQVKLGADLSITPSRISLAPNRCWRPVKFVVEVIGGYVQTPANASDVPGGSVPAAVQLDLCDPSGNYVRTSGIRLLGSIPRRVFVAYPRSGDWFQPTVAANAKIAVIGGICLGPTANSNSQDAYIRGIAHFVIQYGAEAVGNTCPTSIRFLSSDDLDETASNFSELSLV